jgi:hypothetical protein
MKLTNDSYVIKINTKTAAERYYRDEDGWLKVSARGKKFRATAEQVLNHVLPVLAGIKPALTLNVEYQGPSIVDDRARPNRSRT